MTKSHASVALFLTLLYRCVVVFASVSDSPSSSDSSSLPPSPTTANNGTTVNSGMGVAFLAFLGSPLALLQSVLPEGLAFHPLLPLIAYSSTAFVTTLFTLAMGRLWRYLDRAFYTHVTLQGNTRSYEW